jgi:hypothetical protein
MYSLIHKVYAASGGEFNPKRLINAILSEGYSLNVNGMGPSDGFFLMGILKNR